MSKRKAKKKEYYRYREKIHEEIAELWLKTRKNNINLFNELDRLIAEAKGESLTEDSLHNLMRKKMLD